MFRLLLFPVMVALEILLLLLTLALAILRPRWALPVCQFCRRALPDREWYWGRP